MNACGGKYRQYTLYLGAGGGVFVFVYRTAVISFFLVELVDSVHLYYTIFTIRDGLLKLGLVRRRHRIKERFLVCVSTVHFLKGEISVY